MGLSFNLLTTYRVLGICYFLTKAQFTQDAEDLNAQANSLMLVVSCVNTPIANN